MNNDLISRDYVEKIIESGVVDLNDGTEEWRSFVNETCYDILNKVHNAPTMNAYPFEQVQELVKLNQQFAQEIENLKRPKGKWIEVNINPVEFGGYTCDKKCPFCGHITSEYLPKFCSHCGADMGGEE